MRVDTVKQILEAAIFAADTPLTRDALLNLFADERNAGDIAGEKLDRRELDKLLASLQQDYAQRGVELREVASGFRFQVRSNLGPWVSRLWQEKAPRYSRATLETLALIAYRQPITRGEIEDVRGVSVSSQIIKTLLERDWIRLVGHRDVPGRPALYATTRVLLDYFNLKSLDELPTLAAIRDLDAIDRELADAGGDADDRAAVSATADVTSLQEIEPAAVTAVNLGVEAQELARIDAMLDDFNTNYTPATDTAQPSARLVVEPTRADAGVTTTAAVATTSESTADDNTAVSFEEKAQ